MGDFDSRDGTGSAIGKGAFMGRYISGTHGSGAPDRHSLHAVDLTMTLVIQQETDNETASWKADRAEFTTAENVCFCCRRMQSSKLQIHHAFYF